MVIVAFRDIREDNAIGPLALASLAEVVGPEEVAVVVVAAAK